MEQAHWEGSFLTINRFRTGLSAVFSGGAGGATAPPEFGGSQKEQSLISAHQRLAITMNTHGFEKLHTALGLDKRTGLDFSWK